MRTSSSKILRQIYEQSERTGFQHFFEQELISHILEFVTIFFMSELYYMFLILNISKSQTGFKIAEKTILAGLPD
jgi:hypothetical protein